ncbi:MAG: ABC transporter permease [Oscillospiraceae bacterium]|nr:ABC transporter permease [Oscillospiraceae bacterium]
MKNIIKSEFLKLRKDRFCSILFLVFLIVGAWTVSSSMGISPDGKKYAGDNAVTALALVPFIIQFFLCAFVPHACGADFKDKTYNYEIMSGHTRAEVYFGKVIAVIITGTLISIVLFAACIGVSAIGTDGWGDSVQLSDILMKIFIMMFCFIRIICVYIFLTYIIKNMYAVVIIGFVFSILFSAYAEVTSRSKYILGIINLKAVNTFDAWCTFTVKGDKYSTFDLSISSELATGTIIYSLIAGCLVLLLGYAFFRHDDMN